MHYLAKFHSALNSSGALRTVVRTSLSTCALLLAMGLLSPAARAATLTWDASGTGTITDGTGTWSTTGTNWDNGGSDSAWTNGNDAVIGNGGTAGTITVGSGGVSADSITFNPVASGTYYTITSGTITLTGGAIATNAASATINSTLAGSAALVETGTGTLNLGNANGYTGSMTVNAGGINITGPQFTTFSMSGISVASGAVFSFSTGADANVAAPVTGTGTIIASGAGTSLRMTANNQPFAGTFQTLNHGSIDFVNTSTGWSANAAYVLNGDWMRFYGTTTGSTIDLGSLSGTTAGSQIGNWNGGGTTTLRLGALGSTTSFAGAIVNAFSGSAVMAVTKTGAGTQVLTGTNSYSGATAINGGTLQIDGAGALVNTSSITIGTGTLQITGNASLGTSGTYAGAFTDNGAFIYNSGASQTLSAIVSGTGSLTQSGPGTLTLAGGDSYSGATTVSSGTLVILVQATGSRSSITTASGAVTVFQQTANLPFGWMSGNVIIQGAGDLVKTGSFSMYDDQGSGQQFMVAQSAGALFDFQAGTMQQGGTPNSGFRSSNLGSLNLASGATLDLYAGPATVDALTGSGTVTNTYGAADTLTVGVANDTASANNPYFSGNTATFSGVISGGANLLLTKAGTGTEILTGSNTYTGATTVSGGTLQIGNGSTGSLSNSTAITTGSLGTLLFDEATSSTQSNTISNSGTVVGAEGAGIINTLSGVISGTGAFTQSGAGETSLSAANTYSGTTSVTSGTLQLDLSGRSSSISIPSPNSVGAGGTLVLLGGATTSIESVYSNNLSVTGSGTLDKTGAGDVEFWTGGASIKNFTGQINILNGILGSNASDWGSSAGLMNVFIASGAYLDLRTGNAVINQLTGSGTAGTSYTGTPVLTVGNNNGSSTFGGSILDSLSFISGATGGGHFALTKSGTGTLTLTGSNSYTGATTINAGTLQVGNGGATGSLANTAVSGSAGGTLAFNLSSSGTFGGAITGPISVAQNGSGNTTLSAGNTFTGPTSVNAGQLTIQNIQAWASGITTVAGGAIFDASVPTGSQTVSVPSVVFAGTGTIRKDGTGTWFTGTGGGHDYFNMSAGGLIDIEGGVIQNNDGGTSFVNNFGSINIASGATLDLYAENGQMDALTGGGTLQNGFASNGLTTATIGVSNGSGTFSGVISSAGGSLNIVKIGTGTETLSGSNSYTGSTTIGGGTLIVSGSISGTASVSATGGATLEVDGLVNNSATTSLTAGSLQGTGSVGAVTLASASTLAPGYTASSGFGASTSLSAGSVTFSDTASKLSIGIGIVSGSDNTQLASSGTVTLDKTPLQLTLGAAANSLANVNMVYVIVNGGAGSTGSGTNLFTYNGATLANNGTFLTGGGYEFQVSYGVNAADTAAGSDIDLTMIAIPEPDTWATILGGFAMLIGLQRRRRSRLK